MATTIIPTKKLITEMISIALNNDYEDEGIGETVMFDLASLLDIYDEFMAAYKKANEW